jgi:hypothetical protein
VPKLEQRLQMYHSGILLEVLDAPAVAAGADDPPRAPLLNMTFEFDGDHFPACVVPAVGPDTDDGFLRWGLPRWNDSAHVWYINHSLPGGCPWTRTTRVGRFGGARMPEFARFVADWRVWGFVFLSRLRRHASQRAAACSQRWCPQAGPNVWWWSQGTVWRPGVRRNIA